MPLEVQQNALRAPEDAAPGNKAASLFSLRRKNKIVADCLLSQSESYFGFCHICTCEVQLRVIFHDEYPVTAKTAWQVVALYLSPNQN